MSQEMDNAVTESVHRNRSLAEISRTLSRQETVPMTGRLSDQGVDITDLIAERDRLKRQLEALSSECGPSCASQIQSLNKFVEAIRAADKLSSVSETAWAVRQVLKDFDKAAS